MREIKFRAWDGEKMLSTIRLTAAHGIRLVSSSDLELYGLSDYKCIFMQYTGLKDKNGREIYENDVLKEYNGDISEVVFIETEAGFYARKIKTGDCRKISWNTTLEVIGNIYENQELIPTQLTANEDK